MADADVRMAADVAAARSVYNTLKPWIDKYHGGMPAGFLAAAITHESGGNFGSAGDPFLGEVGYLQVAEYVPALFGYPAEARLDPESNIAIGSLEYALEAAKWAQDVPQVRLGSDDSWKLARLAFAIGRGGSRQLASMASSAFGGLTSGDVYHDIARYVGQSGGVPLGSQSASKVQSRVLDIDRQWAIGQQVASGWSGPPTYIPDPPAGPYVIPDDVAGMFVRPISGFFWIVAGGLALAYLIYERTR